MNEELSQAKQLFFDVAPYLKAGKHHEALGVMLQAVDLIKSLDIPKQEQKKIADLIEKVVHRINMDTWFRQVGLEPLEYSPGREHILYNLVLRMKQDLRLAEKYYKQRELENEIRRIDSLYEKGLEYMEFGDTRRALAIFNKLARDYDCSAERLIDIGNRLKGKGEHLGAVSFFERAVEKEPDNSEYHTLAAYAFQKIRQLDKAENYFLSSFKGSEDIAGNYLNLAKFYIEARMWDKAHEAIQDALEKDPHDPQAQEMFKRIEEKVFVHDPSELKDRTFLTNEEEEAPAKGRFYRRRNKKSE